MIPAPSDADDERVEQILEAWFARRHAGADPDLDELCADAPELLPRLRRMLERHEALLGEAGPTTARPPITVDRLGDYRLKARLGAGGMGEVFLARQESLGRYVALKVLRPELAAEPSRRIRFRREAEITAALDHPNIVPVYETGEDQGHVFLAMKLLHGDTLEHLLGASDPRRVAEIGVQVARALHAAHEVGIVHRDVKPANILLEGERPFVLDFGLARARVDLTLTQQGHVAGTLAYMPPEQLQGGPAALDPRVDVYSLGATLYHCLSGRPPFPGDRPEVLVRRILVHDPPPLRLPSAHRDMETIVLRALDKEPARRFPSAREMADDLERYVEGYPIRSRPSGVVRRVYKLARRHRAASVVLAIGLAAVVVLVALLWSSVRAERLDRKQQITRVEEALARGRYRQAFARVRELNDRHGGDDAEVADLEWHTRSALQREALLDQLQADRRYQDIAHLRALDVQLDATGHPSVLAEPRTVLARVMLAFYGADIDAVRLGLADRRLAQHFPRCCAALGALAADRDPLVALGGVGDAHAHATAADDHVFTAVVLWIAERPPSDLEDELVAALRHDPFHERAHVGRALVHALRGDHGRAEDVLRGLWREGDPRPEVHVMLARVAARQGEFDDARRHLAEARQVLEQTARPALFRLDVAELDLLLLERSHGELDRHLARARERWGDSAWLCMIEGYAAWRRNDMEHARSALQRAAQLAELPWNQRRAAAALLFLDVDRWALGCEQTGTADEDEALVLERRATSLLDAARGAHDAAIEAEVLVDLHTLHSLRGLSERAWETLRDALRAEDLNADANHRFVGEVFDRVWTTIERPNEDVRIGELAREARDRARAVAEKASRDPAFITTDKLFELLAAAAGLAVVLGDRDTAVWAGARAQALVGDGSNPGFVRVLDECKKQLGLDAWPTTGN